MKTTIVATPKEIFENIVSDIESSANTNSYGERISEYYSFLKDEEDNNISVQVTEEKNGLPPEEYFYSVHLVDNITEKDCELFSTDEFSQESLFKLISSIIENTINTVQE